MTDRGILKKGGVTWFRWQLSVAAWWLWLKVTPEHPFKREMIDSVAQLGRKWRLKP